jgi:hypothetical protein
MTLPHWARLTAWLLMATFTLFTFFWGLHRSLATDLYGPAVTRRALAVAFDVAFCALYVVILWLAWAAV